MSIRLIHVTPELPPTVGGVADYTAILSRRLTQAAATNIESVLVRAGRKSSSEPDVDYRVVDVAEQCSAPALTETVRRLIADANGRAIVLLEYSGYGYAETGAPLWLARALETVRQESRTPVITMFHELYASGPPWTRAFWLSPLQRHVAARLARLSAAVVTNRHSAVPWLRRKRKSTDSIHVQPVFSNVGEPDQRVPFTNREPRMVVFGGGGRKSRVYEENEKAIRYLLSSARFEEIIDIGPSEGLSVPNDVPVSFRGTLPSKEISGFLSSSRLGILSYPGTRLSKSGAVAAFASHGVPFLLFDEEPTPGQASPYVEGEHFWRCSTLSDPRKELKIEGLREISRALRELYDRKLHSRHSAACFLDIMHNVLPNDYHASPE